MSENSKIEWCHHTFNPWIGCTKVGPGCDHCYAEADFDKRRHVVQWGAGQQRKRTVASNWVHPLRWNAEAERLGIRYRVFCASLADVFDNEVPAEWRADLFDLIERTPHLDWLLVTKRIGNVRQMIPDRWSVCMPPNLWLGITVVNQAEADRDIPKLLGLKVSVRFLSMEPLLGPVELNGHDYTVAPGLGEGVDWLTGHTNQHSSIFGGDTMPWLYRDGWELPKDAIEPRIHWVIVGGESGQKARPMHLNWAREIRDQCAAAGVPFLFKQWGEWIPAGQALSSGGIHTNIHEFGYDEIGRCRLHRLGKKSTGRLLDGVQHDGYPGLPA